MNQLKYRVLGVMSGTSLDGLDLCLVDFKRKSGKWEFEIVVAETLDYDDSTRKMLIESYTKNGAELARISATYSAFLGDVIENFLTNNGVKNLDFIASHGHTVHHDPANKTTIQIGNGPELFQKLNIPIVCDFRVQDVLLGGQGAPLVPIGDDLLFGEFGACLNLGGFANVSMRIKHKRHAWDICPVNIVLNQICESLGCPFDDGGEMAKNGIVIPELLEALNQLPFYQKTPPKSLGRDWVEKQVFPLFSNQSPHNLLRTYVEHVATQIGNDLNRLSKNKTVLVTGGGAFNTFLTQRIASHTSTKLIVPNAELINFKEALIFGLLGVLRWTNQPNCLEEVTGAKADHSAGRIYR